MSDTQKLDEILLLVKTLNDRLWVVEQKVDLDSDNQNDRRSEKETENKIEDRQQNAAEVPEGPISGLTPHDVSPAATVAASHDVNKEFEVIRDSVARISLPPWLKVHDTQAGIKQEHKQTLKVISKTARYTETGLKLLSTFKKEDDKFILTEDDVVHCILC